MNPLYTLATPAVFKEVKSSLSGLTSKEAQKRLAEFGPNRIEKKGGKGPLKIFLSQFWNLMVLILMVGVSISSFLGEWIDAIAILMVIVLNAVIGFLQEYKAEKAIEALRKMTAAYALALRDGSIQKVPAEQLVPGDIVILEEGTQVPTDGKLLEVEGMKTIEASLTGESNAVEKSLKMPKKAESLGDLCHMAFMGTVISQGHGRMVVLQTGMKTEFGQIAQMVQEQKDEATPLQKKITQLIQTLSLLTLGVMGVVFLLAVLQGKSMSEVLLLCISLAVSVIPEGLPTIITLTLALGVQKLAKENAVVRRLSAAETLGSTDIICTDKTGTLTQNQMTVEALYINGYWKDIQGNGYAPEPQFKPGSQEETLLLQIGGLCNNATLFKSKNLWNITGDPTEGALLTLAEKGGLDLETLQKKWPRKKELVFDSFRKRMSTLNQSTLFTKGAPDSVLETCTHLLERGKEVPLTPALKKSILKEIEQKSSEAYRLLGMAYGKHKKIPKKKIWFLWAWWHSWIRRVKKLKKPSKFAKKLKLKC
ncbi:HAD-IC family P-type ATPase [Candidatus Peregrinibacteria bacterium]|nr:MAG: HAD-IC family P-type ATPase [Candidatus Peregrinibacteria bacterium]